MNSKDVSVVLVHGAWADGSSWSRIIGPLADGGVRVSAPSLPLTSFSDDVAALDRALERMPEPVVLAGHAYGGAVIGGVRGDKVKALVYVAGLAPDEGETVANVFYRAEPHPQAPRLTPDAHGVIYPPERITRRCPIARGARRGAVHSPSSQSSRSPCSWLPSCPVSHSCWSASPCSSTCGQKDQTDELGLRVFR